MRGKWNIKIAVLAVLVLAGILAQAAGAGGNFHFKSYNLSIGSLVLNGDLAGVGNETVTVTLTGYGTIKAMCQNKGGQQAPGRNSIEADAQQEGFFTTDENGRVLVNVTTQDPKLGDIDPSPTPKDAGCPNGNWTVVDTVKGSMNWKTATIVVVDSSEQVQIDLFLKCTTFFNSSGQSTGIECKEN